jgi:hypothetical protein
MTIKKSVLAVVILMAAACAGHIYAFDWSKAASAISNGNVESILNGVISNDNVNVADLVGTWKSTGPAVSFQSENLLKRAGGLAAASTVENRLVPYYKRAGLNNATFTFTKDGKVSVKTANGKVVNGTVKKGAKAGTMIFSFNALNPDSKLGTITAHVTKGSELSVMFDVTKLNSFVSAVAKYSGNTTAGTVSSILNGYNGMYAGFKLKK